MATHRIDAHELFQLIHPCALLNEDSPKKSSGELISHALEPCFCHDHFTGLFWRFKLNIKALTIYLDGPLSIDFQKHLPFVMVSDDGGRCNTLVSRG